MENDLVSIIMPVYQAEQWLKDSVESVLHQTVRNFELLLIDDASTDASGRICDELAMNNMQIRSFHQSTRSGVSASRNKGLSQAKGKYIMFLDCDDTLLENTLELLTRKMIETNVDILFFNYSRCYESDRQENNYVDLKEGLYQFEEIQYVFRSLFEFRIANNIGTKIYKKEILEKVWFDEEADIFEDIRFCLSVIRKAESVYFVNECFYVYQCKNLNSLSSTFKQNYYVNLCKFLQELYEFEKGTQDFEYWFARTVMSQMRGAIKTAKRNKNTFRQEFELICKNADVQASKEVFKQNAYKDISLKDKIQYMVMWNQLYLGGLLFWR